MSDNRFYRQTEAAWRAEGHPGYWRNETSGVLRPVVEAYLAGQPLNAMQIAAMRAYLRQWVKAAVWDRNPHATEDSRLTLTYLRWRVDELNDRQAIAAWLHEANASGLDPL